MKPINLKFCAPFKINIQKREELSNFKKPVFDEENQKCVHWILRLSNRDKGYLILKFSALIIFICQGGLDTEKRKDCAEQLTK